MKQSKFSLQMPSGWVINGVNYRDRSDPIDLSQRLLEPRTQDEFAKQRKGAKKDEFYVASMPFYHSFSTTLFDNKENKEFKNGIDEVRHFIKESMFKYWLGTLTRLRYNPKNKKDLMIHDYNQPQQRIIKLDSIVGPDSYILKEDTKNVVKPLQAFLETRQSLEEINNIYKWLTGTSNGAYLIRLNETPNESLDTVARFYANSDWAGLDCDGGPYYSVSALGVRRANF